MCAQCTVHRYEYVTRDTPKVQERSHSVKGWPSIQYYYGYCVFDICCCCEYVTRDTTKVQNATSVKAGPI